MKVITTNLLNRFWKNGVKPIKEAVTGKLDASKVVNSLLATEEGFALDATQGKALKDQVDELNRKLFLDGYFFVDFGSLPNSTTKLVDTDIPNTATHYWIDAGWAKTRGGNGSYTLPYIDPNNWNNSIRVLLNANRQREVTTTTDWSGYPAYFIVAYKL